MSKLRGFFFHSHSIRIIAFHFGITLMPIKMLHFKCMCVWFFFLFLHIELYPNQIGLNAVLKRWEKKNIWQIDRNTNTNTLCFGIFNGSNLPSHYRQWECVSAVIANSNGYQSWWWSRYEYRWRRRLSQNRGCINLTMARHWKCCIWWWMTDYVIVQNIG